MSAVSITQVIPGDDHHLAFTGLVTIALQLVCFFIAYLLQFDKITDFAGSANFVLLALLTFFLGGAGYKEGGGAALNPRAAILTGLVLVTRVELAAYLLYRVLARGKDERFDAIRLNFLPFLAFWIFQMLWVWGVCLPVLFVNTEVSRAPLGAADGVGIAMWAIGFAMQVLADVQKNAFRSDPANNGKWCDVGLWGWSRHPNYFGEILLWWGIFVAASPQFFVSASPALAWCTILSPLLTMFILLCLSGIPSAEGDNQLRFMRTPQQAAAYAAYRARTSPLIPLPPALYASIPLPIQQWALFEWKRYEATPPATAGAGLPAALAAKQGEGSKAATETTALRPPQGSS